LIPKALTSNLRPENFSWGCP